ncbi:MAG: hypothetical protein RL681_35 [Candidatus Parcubacteria bacterium]|jgi:2'-5' RNA ligase
MSHRLFVAIPASKGIHDAVYAWRKQYRNLPVRWVAPKNLHVTVIPPWEEEDIDAVLDVLRMAEGSIGPFTMNYTLVRYGPTLREPRLIWAEGEAPDQLFTAKHTIERALTRNADKKPFRLHMTVARFDPARFPKFSAQNINDAVLWTEEARTFVLMESILSPSGADYSVLGEFRL